MLTIKVKGINTPKNIINGAITQDSDIEALFWSETVNDDKETRKILKEIEKRTLSFPLQGSAMFFFLHRKHGFVPYVKKCKKTLDL